ncbi:hypothetical protein D9M73_146300 [compost metagenome]
MEGAEWRQAKEDRQRPGDHDHPQRQAQGRQDDREQLMGCYQQAQDHEHADLRQPGQAVEHVQDAVAGTDRPVAEEQAEQVDGEDAAAVHGVGQGEGQHATGHHQQRVQAVGQGQAVDQLQHQPAAGEAHRSADAELLDDVDDETPAETGLAGSEHLDQGYREEHGHGVVAARLDFQGGADPFVEAAPAK